MNPIERSSVLVFSLAVALAGCGGEASEAPSSEPDAAAVAEDAPAPDGETAQIDPEIAIIAVEGMGEIAIELFPGRAPKTVENFKKLIREGFYDGDIVTFADDALVVDARCPAVGRLALLAPPPPPSAPEARQGFGHGRHRREHGRQQSSAAS